MTARASLLSVNGVDLAIDEFGPSTAPTIVLVPGASSTRDWWDDEFCELLAAGGRHVIRYDLRDTGGSTTVPAGSANYTHRDLFDDLVALIETRDAAPAHLVGLSMGGGLAQQVAMLRPDLLATVTLVSTSAGDTGGEQLPPPDARFQEAGPEASPDWSDTEAVGDYWVASERLFAGDIPVDEDRVRRIGVRATQRSIDPEASSNHWSLETGEGLRDDIESIGVPTLIMHGTADPLFPYPHAEHLHRRIPGSRLVPIPGMGHQFPPPPTWDLVVGELLRHTA